MAKVSKFEDLIAWQKARILANEVYRVTKNSNFKKDWGLIDQIQRATVSIGSNIAEGFERNRPREFHQFLYVAKGSCGEVRSLAYLAYDLGYLNENDFQKLIKMTKKVNLIINGLRASIQKWYFYVTAQVRRTFSGEKPAKFQVRKGDAPLIAEQ